MMRHRPWLAPGPLLHDACHGSMGGRLPWRLVARRTDCGTAGRALQFNIPCLERRGESLRKNMGNIHQQVNHDRWKPTITNPTFKQSILLLSSQEKWPVFCGPNLLSHMILTPSEPIAVSPHLRTLVLSHSHHHQQSVTGMAISVSYMDQWLECLLPNACKKGPASLIEQYGCGSKPCSPGEHPIPFFGWLVMTHDSWPIAISLFGSDDIHSTQLLASGW